MCDVFRVVWELLQVQNMIFLELQRLKKVM